jgi:hypothetical protein
LTSIEAWRLEEVKEETAKEKRVLKRQAMIDEIFTDKYQNSMA